MECLAGVCLKEGETVITQAKPSFFALIVTWASIPGVFLIYFVLVWLPEFLKIEFSEAVKEEIVKGLGVSSFEEINVSSYIFESLLGEVPEILINLLAVLIALIILIWLGWCAVMTYRHFRYKLALTDIRVIGEAAGEILDSPLNEVVDVFIDQSLWGRLFNYGAIVVHTKSKSLTFRNIHKPKKIYGLLMEYASNYCAH